MKSLKIFSFLAVIILLSSCEKLLMDPKPETDALSIFDEYATLVKEKYAMLDFKGVDIDVLADSIRNTIQEELTDKELFDKLSIITSRLRDGHSSLITNKTDPPDPRALISTFDMFAGYPIGIQTYTLYRNYISDSVNNTIKDLPFEGDLKAGGFSFRVRYGTLPQDNEIGYLFVPSWNVGITDDEIEQIFVDLKDTKGLIFDQRLNGGGDPSLATKFAAYFTDKPVNTGFERFKTGPGSNDFSDSQVILQPTSSSNKYLKPVRVLTDRGVYSASTTFLYSVDPIETVKSMGQRTGGGSGSVADGYLANGWYWSLSISEFIDAKGRHLDDGVDPDFLVDLDVDDISKDEVIEAAILDLQ